MNEETRTQPSTLKAWISVLRPHQYVKNAFVFLPVFFALRITEGPLLMSASWAFVCFCLVASAVYIVNDLRDIEFDRAHPEKKFRPLASGQIPKQQAVPASMLLFAFGLGLAWWVAPPLFYVMAIYSGLNLAYSFGLKHVAILDISIVAFGFVLRLAAGAAATGLPLTMWIILITYLLSLFLALGKRGDDIAQAESGRATRKNTARYNQAFIQSAMMMMASVVIVSYIFYTISDEVQLRIGSDKLYYTVFFVILGILRYLQIALVDGKSGNPTKLLYRDRFIQLTIAGWIATFTVLLYL